ncbi:MAG: nucleotidyltransferase domain-containing protein [Candidatus Cloacimonetes bacterium]|nr:nucleotidyltransferase domain-containing protein [Candidatus Cloacimonadota bacterium]
MKQAEVLNILHSFKEKNSSNYQFKKIGIFGSYARDEASNNSDIDVVVELLKPDLFILGDIKTDLEELFGKHIDIVRLRNRMNKFLKLRIEKEAIYV